MGIRRSVSLGGFHNAFGMCFPRWCTRWGDDTLHFVYVLCNSVNIERSHKAFRMCFLLWGKCLGANAVHFECVLRCVVSLDGVPQCISSVFSAVV